MDVILFGGVASFLRTLAAASPTILIGLFIAALMRYYIGPEGTRKLFGGESLRSLPQSWLLGMLLPVCSVGVIPILREMVRVRVKPGGITAFALSAPLFNPLSLLYGLTLSRPYVIVGFALASLLVVTLIGLIWDRLARTTEDSTSVSPSPVVGLARLGACCSFMCRELFGPTGGWTLVAMLAVASIAMFLPHGALQTAAEQGDIWAPARMALIAIPIYATPMQTISQLGMMFAHGNSPGAAFCLLLLGTGINAGVLCWMISLYGWRSTTIWLSSLTAVVLVCAYAVDKPLIPPGVEPAGHTHAFDVYTNPFSLRADLASVKSHLLEKVSIPEFASLTLLLIIATAGAVLRRRSESIATTDSNRQTEAVEAAANEWAVKAGTAGRFDRDVPPYVVGITCLIGLVAFSIVACYAYYPSPNEVLEEMRIARAETLTNATSNNAKEALRWLEVWEEWSRKLEVGSAIRNLELRPYQQMQAYSLRKKLELLEHELEHETLDGDEIKLLVQQLMSTSGRLSKAFRT